MTLGIHKRWQYGAISGEQLGADRDTDEVGSVEGGVQATLAAEVCGVVTTTTVGDDGVDGQRDRPHGVVSVAVKFTRRRHGRPLRVQPQILFRSLYTAVNEQVRKRRATA